MAMIEKSAALAMLAATSLWLAPPAASHEIEFGNLVIVHPWVRPLPHTPNVLAGYLKIINKGTEDDRLIGATAEIAGGTEFDTMNMDNGVMKSSLIVGGIPIPAGKTVALTSKSQHIMFLHVMSQPMASTVFEGTLTFERAGTIVIDFEVDEMATH